MSIAIAFAILVLWVVLDVRVIHRVSEGQPSASSDDRGSAGFVQKTSLSGLALGFAAAAWIPFLDLAGSAWIWIGIGVPIALAGIALRVSAVSCLGAMFSPVVRVEDGHQLVEVGPYRVVRHPSYAGVLVMSLGVGLCLGNLVSLIVIPGLRLLGYVRRISVEEDALERQLGARYVDYARQRARLIPGVW